MQVKRRTSLLPISTLIRIKKKTKLHTEELQQMYERFCKQYPGGTANLDQFKDVYETFYPGSRVTEFSQLIFQNIDADSNGNVTFEEYLCAFVMINRGSPEQKINWIFNLYDANNDGLISSEEFLHLLQAMYGLLGIRGSETAYLGQMSPEQHVKTFFKRLDLDGDGSISREEFYRGALVDPTILQILKLVRLI